MSEWSLPARPVVGIVHPGAMGAAVGAALRPRAGAVVWAAEGRSADTAKRAELADLVAVPDLPELVRRADVIVSICPPHAARAVAEEIAQLIGTGPESGTASAGRPLYVDANAVSPATVRGIGELLGTGRVVDGSLIGPPPWEPGRTVLWLSGERAAEIAALLEGSPLKARVLGPQLGTASGLKACFALRSKVLPALWLELDEAARAYGVAAEVQGELARLGFAPAAELAAAAEVAGEKGWRWAGEMDQAAEAFAEVGLPEGFSRAAAQVYRRGTPPG